VADTWHQCSVVIAVAAAAENQLPLVADTWHQCSAVIAAAENQLW